MRRQPRQVPSRTCAALIACAWMALGAIHIPTVTFAADEANQIRAIIGATWDKPDSKVETDPIVVSGHYAVASWTQNTRGGRALLRRDDKGWSVILCSGDPHTKAHLLVEAGVPPPDAETIARDLEIAETRTPKERRAKFSLFEGNLPTDAGVSAPHPHQHHKN